LKNIICISYIDADYVKDWADLTISESWSPYDLYLNTAYTGVLFIRLQEEILLVSIQEQPIFLSNIRLDAT
jgi:hypothetical protein